MRKLKLDPDALTVETFAADDGREGARGTVFGRLSEYCATVYNCSRAGENTCSPDICGGGGTDERACYTEYIDCETVRWICFTDAPEYC